MIKIRNKIKSRAWRALLIAAVSALPFSGKHCRAQQIIGDFTIFDNEAAEMAEGVQILGGRIVLTGATPGKEGKATQPDPVGGQILELTDGSQLHGQMVSLGRSEFVWKRGDTIEPLIFSPQDVQRIAFSSPAATPDPKANVTLKLHGGDWLTGELAGFENGRFQLVIEGAGRVEIERSRVEWIYLAPSNPPDAYEGPMGPMGLAGWDTGGPGGASAWDYADGALAARAAMALTRVFTFLPEKMDLEFSASDGGNAIRGLTLWLQPGAQLRGYSKGSVYLRFQGNNITANSYDGSQMKNLTATVPENKKPPKETRYRLLHDKRNGKLLIFVNGGKVADWDLQPQKEPAQGGSLSWQPTYWSSNMAWTLSKVRVRPWDGDANADLRPEEAGKDVLTVGTTRHAGTIESISGDSVRFSDKGITRGGEPIFIRLAAGQPVDPPPGPAARVWLTHRGEFDVTALGVRDGQLKVRTTFGGDLSLPLDGVRALEFPHRLSGADKALADGGDLLLFRNSDELRGTLVSATHDQAVKWKPIKGDRFVEFAVNRIAGVLLAKKVKPAVTNATAAVRFRNGDWLPGEMMLLSKENLLFKSQLAEPLPLDRSGIHAIYFSQSGEIPVWDGASDRQLWMKGSNTEGRFSSRTQRSGEIARRNPWRYLDGSFTLPSSLGRGGYGSGPNIGRVFESLPEKTEVRFELSTPDGQAGYSLQLFSDENRPGLMVQGSWDNAYIYDMAPRNRGGAFNQPQQIEFSEQIGSEGNRRQFRFLGDRRSGRLTMIVNGIPVGQFGQRAGKEAAKPGKGIAIIPQQMNSSVTVSNLWVGPWSGDPPAVSKSGAKPKQGEPESKKPGEAKPAEEKEKSSEAAREPAGSDLITLVNGDESSGQLEKGTPSELSLKCDAGTIEVPVSRTLMVEFAGADAQPAAGLRLHLAGKGTLTVDSLRIADGKVVCHSASMGDLTFTSELLSEIVFQPRNLPPPEREPREEAANTQAPNGQIFIRGGGRIEILNGNGPVIINR